MSLKQAAIERIVVLSLVVSDLIKGRVSRQTIWLNLAILFASAVLILVLNATGLQSLIGEQGVFSLTLFPLLHFLNLYSPFFGQEGFENDREP